MRVHKNTGVVAPRAVGLPAGREVDICTPVDHRPGSRLLLATGRVGIGRVVEVGADEEAPPRSRGEGVPEKEDW